MTLLEQYDSWLAAVGTEDCEQGVNESEEWVNLHFDPDEFYGLYLRMLRDAMATALAEGKLENLPIAIFHYTFRFATHLEAEKHTPTPGVSK